MTAKVGSGVASPNPPRNRPIPSSPAENFPLRRMKRDYSFSEKFNQVEKMTFPRKRVFWARPRGSGVVSVLHPREALKSTGILYENQAGTFLLKVSPLLEIKI